MTVITKPLSEKKSDKLDDPLVENIHTEFPEVGKHSDVEIGGAQLPPGGDPRLLVIRRPHARKSSSATTVCLFLTAVLVMCCGIIAGVYLYKQFASAQIHKYKGWCRIPYDESGAISMLQTGASGDDESLTDLIHKYQRISAKNQDNYFGGNSFREEFEIDAEDESYEKINVPDFSGGRRSRFIHDFNANKTGIIDLEGKRCFVMPLNRTQVLPPKNLLDLVQKMYTGYYELDTSVLHQTMRVVLPALQEHDVSQMGFYITNECNGLPVYKLEKVVSGVFKRSADPIQKFTVFSGKITSFDILNISELDEYENNLRTKGNSNQER